MTIFRRRAMATTAVAAATAPATPRPAAATGGGPPVATDSSVGPPAARDAAHAAAFEQLRRELDADFPRVAATPTAYLDDACLWRHLRACNYAVAPAAVRLRATLAWRATERVDALMVAVAAAATAAAPAADTATTPVSGVAAGQPTPTADDRLPALYAVSATGKQFVRGVCAAGRPVLYMRPSLGVAGLKDSAGNIWQLVYNLERAAATMRVGVEKLTLLIDFRGYTRRVSPTWAIQRQTLAILQDHHPERLGLAVMWAAPALFHVAFRLLRPFIDPVTAAKIVFLSPGVPADVARMGELFGTQLLAEYGGDDPWVYTNDAYFGVDGGGGVLPFHLQ